MKKIFLTLALGVATITFAQQMDRPAKMDPEQRKAEMQKRQQKHLDRITKELNLSQDQVKKIKELEDKQMADMHNNMQQRDKERKAKMDEMKKRQDAHAAEMKKILTPEQYQKWDADKKAKMEKRREMMKDKRGEHGKGKMMKKSADAPVVE